MTWEEVDLPGRPPPIHFSCAGGHVIEKANHRLDPIAIARHEVGALYQGLVPRGAQTPGEPDVVAEPVRRPEQGEAQVWELGLCGRNQACDFAVPLSTQQRCPLLSADGSDAH